VNHKRAFNRLHAGEMHRRYRDPDYRTSKWCEIVPQNQGKSDSGQHDGDQDG
jgi:hypothetical protein